MLLNSSWLMSDSEVCSLCNQDKLLASGRGVTNSSASTGLRLLFGIVGRTEKVLKSSFSSAGALYLLTILDAVRDGKYLPHWRE